jgi:predicted nucleotidyltransferase
MEFQAHHRRAIDRLTDEYRDDKRFNALIIGGSVAKGFARPDSDVDFLIVATDDEFNRRRMQDDLFINRTDLCDYDGGYVDGKIVNHAYLEELADKGNEPSRAAFEGAFAAWAASQLALFSGRLILAHNRTLFPYHKWLTRTLESVEDKPVELLSLIDALLEKPNAENADALFQSVKGFQDWGVSDLEAYTWFMTEVEWAWMSGITPMEDW